jgi:predicted dehydrogenase
MTKISKIRVGLIGVGNWAEYGHLPALKLLPDYELAAVHSRDIAKATQLAQRHGIPRALDSVEALVNHPEVDLVVVLNTAPQHEATVQAAIAAGKDVYCEWPLTPSKAVSQELMVLAEKAGVRHIVGLQRRLGPDYRYLRDLLKDGYIGELRSVRLHISVEYFQRERKAALHFTIPPENFSSLLSIYGGHYFDAVFTMLGHPDSISALTVNQFPEVTLIETGEVLKHTTADQVIVNGTFRNGAVLTAHIEAGKRNNYGMQLDLTGTKGDIKLWNTTSFGNAFNMIEGAQGDSQPMHMLKVPPRYNWLPETDLGGSQQELANLYAAYASDLRDGTHWAPTFADALRMHELIDAIDKSNREGVRVQLAR